MYQSESSQENKIYDIFQTEGIDYRGLGRIRGGKKEEEGYLETRKPLFPGLAPTISHLLPRYHCCQY